MNSKFYDNSIFAQNLKRILERKDISAAELARQLGVSKAAVSDWLKGKSLPRMDKVDKMCIILNCKREDFTSVPLPEDTTPIPITGFIPVYGEIPAGVPNYEEAEVVGYVSISYPHPEQYFALKAKGTSMIGAGIPDGALVTFKKQNFAEDGQIVACRINGEEVTLKRFRKQGATVLLMPENPEFAPIIVNALDFTEGTAEILGVAKEITVKLEGI